MFIFLDKDETENFYTVRQLCGKKSEKKKERFEYETRQNHYPISAGTRTPAAGKKRLCSGHPKAGGQDGAGAELAVNHSQ